MELNPVEIKMCLYLGKYVFIMHGNLQLKLKYFIYVFLSIHISIHHINSAYYFDIMQPQAITLAGCFMMYVPICAASNKTTVVATF